MPCQRAKVNRLTKPAPGRFEVPARCFDHIHVDLVGPLPPSHGYTYLLTVVDRFMRWPEAIPLTEMDMLSCARALVSRWITQFGVPSDITSDRGVQFTSQVWDAMVELYGIRLHWTTAYHPQANGLIERFHRRLKESLKARLKGPNCTGELPWVLLGIRTAPKEDLGTSSAEMVFGAPFAVPGDFIPPATTQQASQHLAKLRETVKELVPVPTSRHNTTSLHVPALLESAKFVFIRRDGHRRPLQTPYEGPFQVLERHDRAYLVDLGSRTELISTERLKPAHTDISAPLPVAHKPRRGRPPKNPIHVQ